MNVAVALLQYAVTPRILVAHSVAGALLCGLVRHGADRKQLFLIAVIQVVAIFALWLFVPNGLGTIAALYFCLYVYEDAVGTKLDVYENVLLSSGTGGVRYKLCR